MPRILEFSREISIFIAEKISLCEGEKEKDLARKTVNSNGEFGLAFLMDRFGYRLKAYKKSESRQVLHMNELRLDLEGTILHLKIEDYTRFEDREKDSYDDYWCSVSIGASNDCINYSITDDEMLTSGEVDYLLNLFKALIKGEKLENNVIEFIEPNLSLVIFPEDSEQNLLVDLHLNLWNGGALTANYISLCLGESDIKKFIEYLEFIVK